MDLPAVHSVTVPDESPGTSDRPTVTLRVPVEAYRALAQLTEQSVQMQRMLQGRAPALQVTSLQPESGQPAIRLEMPPQLNAVFRDAAAMQGTLKQGPEASVYVDLRQPELRLVMSSVMPRSAHLSNAVRAAGMPTQLAALSQMTGDMALALLSKTEGLAMPKGTLIGATSTAPATGASAVLANQFVSSSTLQALAAPTVQPNSTQIAAAILKLAQPTVERSAPLEIGTASGSRVASGQPLGYSQSARDGAERLNALTQSVVRSTDSAGGMKPMLIPDVSPAIPRAIAPDAMPSQVPIRQSVAQELGLKVGQVVQALVASSGDKMGLQFGNRQLPLPQGLQLSEGPITLRVVQTAQGMALVPQMAGQTAAQTGQAAAATGLSAALLSVLSKQGQRGQIHTLLQPGQLEAALRQSGLPDQAARLSGQRLPSDRLTGDVIRQAIQFGSLANEKAIAEGVAMNGGMLKPWLRQMLRLLPQQSELTARLSGLIAELEHLQLESLPQSQVRDSGLSALLLLRDQPPVELLFERQTVTDEEGAQKRLWVINLHTELAHLGEVWMKSSFDQDQVELTLWARESATAKLAKEAKYDLQEALSEHGLTVCSMHIFDQPRPDHRILDEHGAHMDMKA